MVFDYTGSVEGIHAFIYCTKWRSGQVLPMPDWQTDSQMKDRATQLLIKYKSGALVTQREVKKCVQLKVQKPCIFLHSFYHMGVVNPNNTRPESLGMDWK